MTGPTRPGSAGGATLPAGESVATMGGVEPLIAEGTYTEAELVRELWPLVFTPSYVAVQAVVPLVSWPLMFWLLFRGWNGAAGWFGPALGGLLGLGASIDALTWRPRRLTRRHIQQQAMARASHRYALDDFGICTRSVLRTREVCDQQFAWGRVASWVVRRDMLILSPDGRQRILLPKRFFASEETWVAAQALAEKHSKMPALTTPEAPTPPAVDDEAGSIAVSVRMNWRDLSAFADDERAVQNRVGTGKAIAIAAAATVLLLAAVAIFYPADAGAVAIILGICWCVALPVTLILAWGMRYARKLGDWVRFRRHPLVREPIFLRLSGAGVAVAGSGHAGRHPWGGFNGYRASATSLALMIAEGSFILIPRRAVDPPDWPPLIRLVHRHLGVCACGYPLRGATGDACPECGEPVEPDAAVSAGKQDTTTQLLR